MRARAEEYEMKHGEKRFFNRVKDLLSHTGGKKIRPSECGGRIRGAHMEHMSFLCEILSLGHVVRKKKTPIGHHVFLTSPMIGQFEWCMLADANPRLNKPGSRRLSYIYLHTAKMANP